MTRDARPDLISRDVDSPVVERDFLVHVADDLVIIKRARRCLSCAIVSVGTLAAIVEQSVVDCGADGTAQHHDSYTHRDENACRSASAQPSTNCSPCGRLIGTQRRQGLKISDLAVVTHTRQIARSGVILRTPNGRSGALLCHAHNACGRVVGW
jgi:hypothetical protein